MTTPQRPLLDRLNQPPDTTGRAGVLAGRFTTAETERWDQRHTRWTIWIDADLKDTVSGLARRQKRSVRDVVDELLRLGLEASDMAVTVDRGPSTVDRPRSGRRRSTS